MFGSKPQGIRGDWSNRPEIHARCAKEPQAKCVLSQIEVGSLSRVPKACPVCGNRMHYWEIYFYVVTRDLLAEMGGVTVAAATAGQVWGQFAVSTWGRYNTERKAQAAIRKMPRDQRSRFTVVEQREHQKAKVR